MQDFVEILRCPRTHRPLHRVSASALATDGGPTYRISDGVVGFIEDATHGGFEPEAHDFYNKVDWAPNEDGLFTDTQIFVDTRKVSLDFTRRCTARLNKHFAEGGKYLLDAGSGPIPYPELLDYGAKFERRVCVDLGAPALRVARKKLGDRGVYLQGDLTNLPLQDESVDAITCNHVIYTIPAAHQEAALLELWRVLKPGGVAVIVYWWTEAPLATFIERVARRLVRERREENAGPVPDVTHDPHPLSWFESRTWPFRFTIESFRVVDNAFMRRYVSDDWRGRFFFDLLYRFQTLAPRFCGRNGRVPVIIIRKELAA